MSVAGITHITEFYLQIELLHFMNIVISERAQLFIFINITLQALLGANPKILSVFVFLQRVHQDIRWIWKMSSGLSTAISLLFFCHQASLLFAR